MARGELHEKTVEAAKSDARALALNPDLSAARRTPTGLQAAFFGALSILILASLILWPSQTLALFVTGAATVFSAYVLWRVLLIVISRRPISPRTVPETWPRYTILAALHDEADVTPQLIARLAAIDYPEDRLEGFLVLEAHDHETIDAALRTPRPPWLRVLIAPPGSPRTKPRALNVALGQATGELLVIYDAEDDPDPLQLREAAARFTAAPSGRLACLQAPLRIRSPTHAGFVARQFAAEYAALFEVTLPAMARLGLPFPLGGTSNHFRVDVLRSVGGWDAWNVTEDADLGFRLWRAGWRLGVINRPTYESPPEDVDAWLPQRTRWLKGYMQTWGVHTRAPWRLGGRGLAALIMTLGVSLVSAVAHAPSVAWVVTALIVALHAGLTPATPLGPISVMLSGCFVAWATCLIGCRRAHVPYRLGDMLQAPAYWSMLSLAMAHAVWRLTTEPFVWDKTRHRPDDPADA